MNLSFKIRGSDKLKAYLKTVPRGTMKVALEAVAKWLVGDSQSGLRHPEPYKYVSRKSAYGFTFFSDKQRRWWFAALRDGRVSIGNNRTGKSTEAWTYKPVSGGYNYKISNDTVGAYYTRGDKSQARQPAKVGWLKAAAVIQKNMAGAIRAAKAAVGAWLKSGAK